MRVIHPYLISHRWLAFVGLFRSPVDWVGIRQGLVLDAVYTALFLGAALLVFSRKFAPEWRPRYLCVERLSDLLLVGVAYLRVESLLTPPGPWTKRAALKV